MVKMARSISIRTDAFSSDRIRGAQKPIVFNVEGRSLRDKVKILIIRDLYNLGWNINITNQDINISPPGEYDKAVIKTAMSIRRDEILQKNQMWIDRHIKTARQNLADGRDVLKSAIRPGIEICRNQRQHDLYRMLRYYWSAPYSEYVGRRLRLIIRDKGLPTRPVIGIAALGSSIIHIPERDDWLGWDKATRTENLIYTMDAYVIGALPPYNYLLGGKLVSYLLASSRVRDIYRQRYKDKVTLIGKRKADRLAGIFTTSLYGKSSQYNRIKYNGELLYKPIGETKGYGTVHLSLETIQAMRELLEENQIHVGNVFGDGPIWTMRLIREAGNLLGFDADVLLRHSFKRNIYFVPTAENYREFLNGETKRIKYNHYSVKAITEHWKERWYSKRVKREETIRDVERFKAEDFNVKSLSPE